MPESTINKRAVADRERRGKWVYFSNATLWELNVGDNWAIRTGGVVQVIDVSCAV